MLLTYIIFFKIIGQSFFKKTEGTILLTDQHRSCCTNRYL